MAGLSDTLQFDPLALLQARALDPSTTGSVAASGGVSPPPAATPPAAPVATAATPAGGGGGSFLGGIGTAMANIMSGAGVSGDIPSDTEIDPVSGIPRGIARRANNQSMMKMGMTLLMAGLSRDPGTRGKMLAALPGTMDSTDTINAFAKTRLEMARTKLLERQILNEEATNKKISERYGVAGSPTATVAGATPIAAPVGGAPAATGAVPATPVAPGAPEALPASPVAAPAPIGAAAPALGAAVQAGAAGVAPIPLTPEAVAGLPTKAPSAPPVPKYVMTDEDRVMVDTIPTASGKLDYLSKQSLQAANRQIKTAPYKVPEMNAVMVDVYQGGQKIGSEKVADIPSSIVETPNKRGGVTRRTVTPSGAVTGMTDIAGPSTFRDTPHPTKPGTIIREKIGADGSIESRQEITDAPTEEARKIDSELVKGDRDTLKTNYEKTIRPGVDRYKRLDDLKAKVLSDKAVLGTGSDARRAMLNALASAGWLDKSGTDRLVNTTNVEAELGRAAGEFAKNYYGPQISNADVTNANRLLGAVMSNDKTQIAAAINRVQEDIKNFHRAYHEDAVRHNSNIPKHLEGNRGRLEAPMLPYNYDADTPSTPDMDPAAAAAAAAAELQRRRRK